jgi:hypothetical protein
MKMKNSFQYPVRFLWYGIFQVHPKKEIGVRQQGGHQKYFDVLGVKTALCGKRE